MVFSNFLNTKTPTVLPSNYAIEKTLKKVQIAPKYKKTFGNSSNIKWAMNKNFYLIQPKILRLYPSMSDTDQIRASAMLEPLFLQKQTLTDDDINFAVKQVYAQKQFAEFPDTVNKKLTDIYNSLDALEKKNILTRHNLVDSLGLTDEGLTDGELRSALANIEAAGIEKIVPEEITLTPEVVSSYSSDTILAPAPAPEYVEPDRTSKPEMATIPVEETVLAPAPEIVSLGFETYKEEMDKAMAEAKDTIDNMNIEGDVDNNNLLQDLEDAEFDPEKLQLLKATYEGSNYLFYKHLKEFSPGYGPYESFLKFKFSANPNIYNNLPKTDLISESEMADDQRFNDEMSARLDSLINSRIDTLTEHIPDQYDEKIQDKDTILNLYEKIEDVSEKYKENPKEKYKEQIAQLEKIAQECRDTVKTPEYDKFRSYVFDEFYKAAEWNKSEYLKTVSEKKGIDWETLRSVFLEDPRFLQSYMNAVNTKGQKKIDVKKGLEQLIETEFQKRLGKELGVPKSGKGMRRKRNRREKNKTQKRKVIFF